ncbi:MAG TPA: F0F1 ATP synthase subunit B [Candidatus Omnitrophota bacterium]|nr:F0F1 ATP synthase subunit B [Candidatus Omnitrophota bacterium]
MANPSTTETIVHAEESHEAQASFFSPNVSLLLLTWFTFFTLLAVLYKFAWKPILAALDAREETIRCSLEEAQRLKNELAQIEQTRQEMVKKAEMEAKSIVDESRKAAVEAAHHVQQKTKEESQILLDNAKREIKNEVEKAQAKLKAESIDLAIQLAGKLIEKNLDAEKNKQLINEFIKKS